MDISFSTTCTPQPVRVGFGNCPTCFPGAREIAALALCCLTAATAWAAVAMPVGDIATWQAAPRDTGDVTLDDARDDAPGGIASNLLVDPSFENNPLGAYSVVLTNWVTGVWGPEAATITGPVGGVVPPHGARMLRMVDDGLNYTQVVQITDVTAHAAQIDAGVVSVSLSAMLNAGAGVASAVTYVRVAFYTGPSVVFPNGMIQHVATLDASHMTWETLSTSGPIPPGTRWLVTEFGFQNSSIAGSAGYVDATDLTLILPVCQGNETVIEDEPNCGIPVDTVNGGCNSIPEVYGSLTCGQTVCGTYAFDGALRDTDWYKFNTCATGTITWTVTGQDPFQGLIIADGDGDPCNFDCATLAVLAFAQPPAGVPGASVAGAPADGYVVWAGPQFSGLPPCGREYRAVLECSGCVAPPCPPCPPCPPAGPTHRSSYLILGNPDNVPWSWRLSDPLFCAENLCVPGVSLSDDLDSDGCSGTPADVARRFADSINQYSAVNGCFFRLFALVEPLYSPPNPCPIGAILHIDHQSATAPALWVGPCGDPNCQVVFCLPACGCPFNPTIYKIEWSGQDCNGNGWDDILDVLLGSSADVNANGVPDECEWTHAFGLPHVALGQATLTFDPNSGQLVIGNIGDGGQDGVAVQLGAAGSASLGWAEIQASPPGGRIVHAVHGSIAGMPQQELAVANIEHDGSTWIITHDLSNLGVSDYEYVVFNGSSVVMTIAANSATVIEVPTLPHLGAIGSGGGGGGDDDYDWNCYWQQKFPCNDPNWYCSSGWDPDVRCFKVPALEQGMCCCHCNYYFGWWDWFGLLPILIHSPNGPVLVDGTAIGVRLPLPAAWDGPLNLSELRVTLDGIPELRISSEGVGYEGILASALGQAHLSCSNGQIAVSNIGQAGFHGVAFGLQGLTRVGASIAIDPNLLPELPQDAVPVRYTLSAADTGEETCLEFWCAKNTMRIQACDDDTCVQLRLDGSLVLNRTVDAGEEIATTPMYWSHSGAFISGGVMWQYYRWSPPAEFTVPGAGVVLADEVRFRRCVPLGPVGSFDELTVRAAALPALLVTGLGVLAPCPADLSGDRVIDQSDLGILLGNWNCKGRPGDCPGDVNGDGAVDQADLGELLARFSQVCD